MSCKTTSLLAAYLEDRKDTAGVLSLIRDKYPKSMSTYLTMIRKEWLTLDKPGPLYREDLDGVIRSAGAWKARADESESKILESAIEKLRAFDAMNMTEKYAVLRSLKSRNFSGHAPTDGLLAKVRLLPDYVENLKMDAEERNEQQRRSTTSLEQKSSESFTVSAAAILDTARGILASKKCNVFDLSCAISLVTGRRMIEIFRTGTFDPDPGGDTYACVFSGQAKKQGASSSYRIPLLAPLELVNAAMERLRISKNTDDLTNSEVNLKFSSSCNAAARRMLGSGRRFHDCRAVYGVVSFHLALPHTFSLNMFLKKALGHTSLSNSLNYSSIHVTGVREEDRRVFQFDAETATT